MRLERTSCNICHSDKTRSLGIRESPLGDARLVTHLVKCSSCGFIYPNPIPRLDEREIQERFKNPEDYFAGKVTSQRIEKYEKVIETIEKYKPQKGSLLDVGCGRGEFAYAAGKRNWNITGTEVSRSFADYAKEKFSINVLIGDISDLELPDAKFDVVCLNSVIQYVQDPKRTLERIKTLLKTGGILYIEVTNEDAFVFRAGDLFKSVCALKKSTTHLSPLFPSYQLYGFNKKSLSEALRQTGFKIRNIRIKGIVGGGEVKGQGLGNKITNFMRKAVILAGGLTGRGHLMYCFAEKE